MARRGHEVLFLERKVPCCEPNKEAPYCMITWNKSEFLSALGKLTDNGHE